MTRSVDTAGVIAFGLDGKLLGQDGDEAGALGVLKSACPCLLKRVA